jgi:aromatic ring hydroxylase
MQENAKALNSVERKSEIVTKMEGLFSLAIMAYKDAQRQNKDGVKIPDPYAQGILLQRAMEILEKLAELYGFISRKGFVVTQTQVQTQGQGQTLDPELRRRVFYEMVNEHRLERGLAPLAPFESVSQGHRG